MDCPKCTGQLEEQTYGDDLRVQRCNACAGLWCKPDALVKMKHEWMAEAVLDIGDPSIGHKLNKVDEISCPEGHGPLIKSSDAEQSHIWYEECSTCKGIYLDAGELTDLKFNTLIDRIKSRLTPKRPGTN